MSSSARFAVKLSQGEIREGSSKRAMLEQPEASESRASGAETGRQRAPAVTVRTVRGRAKRSAALGTGRGERGARLLHSACHVCLTRCHTAGTRSTSGGRLLCGGLHKPEV